ncbi:MAG TPA: hybrid sensor histidine kinase/response regulator [Leptolyngbyaceae cyanobacterium]
MANSSDIRDQAYQFFVEEAPELLQTIETGLLTLRQDRETARVHEIMRAAHSLKGGAASVGLDAIKTIAHRLETLFKALYSESLVLDETLESQLLQAYDCLRLPLTEQLNQGYFDSEQALTQAEPVLKALEDQFGDAIAETENFIPSSADLGINMAASIFEIDVSQGLAHLKTILAHPEQYEVAGELRAQAEVFTGFAELLNLPGFAAIAQMTLRALDAHPNRVLEIATLALEDFEAGQAAVLAGDNTQGGSPSAALVALAEVADTRVPATETLDLLDFLPQGVTLDFSALTEPLVEMTNAAGLSLETSPSEDLVLENLEPEELALESLTLENPGLENLALEKLGLENLALENLALEDLALQNLALGNLTLEDLELENQEPTKVHTLEFVPESEAEITTEFALPELGSAQLEDILTDFSEEAWATTAPIQEVSPAVAPDQTANTENSSATIQLQLATPQSLEPQRRAVSSTVRVETERLARMDNTLGELTINRNGLGLQNDQVRRGIRELLNRFERVRSTVEQLQTASEQMLVAPERRGLALSSRNGTSRDRNSSHTSTHNPSQNRNQNERIGTDTQPPSFDSLEMDSYTVFYTYTQTLLEEMLQLEEAVEDLSLFNRQSDQLLSQHRKMLSQIQDELMWARMISLSEVLNRFPRILRDLSNRYHKPAELTLSGTHLLIDRAVLEKLYDPLLHLLRNGFDHGLESPDVRQEQGKPTTGQIEIQASYQGRRVLLEVRDDGRGLDLERIRQRVIELGWLSVTETEATSPDQLCEFIFRPGFSTAAEVSDLSGRGMGLDVVREQLALLKGTVAVQSTPGQGTTFTLALPLTLSVVNLLVCFAGATPIALRSDNITEILIPRSNQLSQVGSQQFLQWQDQKVPAYRLSDLLSYACLIPEMPLSRVLAAIPSPADWEAPMLILKRGEQAFALQVDRLVTEQESVIKPFGPALNPPSYAYGCTVLGDGSLIPVIDGRAFLDNLVSRGLGRSPDNSTLTVAVEAVSFGVGQPPIRMHQANTVMVVDDAVTSRRMLALSLERAGYRVIQSRDGQEALEQLQQNPSVQLVVCDIEMPNMNGFEFLTQRRQNSVLSQIPTVMLTSRSNDKHRWLAMQLGATDYFTKPYLEQEFLGAIATHIQS